MLKVDVAKSEQARAEGNTAFKKGKWVDAIGHYTNAAVYNPEDPVAYCNRAQAYLKIDKYNDAERDCTTALGLPKGKGSIKALYRRGLARKGLGKTEEAILDMEEVLRLDKANTAVKLELEELKEAKRKADLKKKAPRRPLASPTPTPTATPDTSLTNGSNPSASISSLTSTTDNLTIQPDAARAPKQESSFASLRKSRDEKKKAFAGISSSSVPAAPAAPAGGDETEAATQAALDAIFPPSKPRAPAVPCVPAGVTPVRDGPGTEDPAEEPCRPALPTTLDTESTAPGAGLVLLRHLASCAAYNFDLVSLYPAGNVPRILGGVLEPDTLGVLLFALAEGAGRRGGGGGADGSGADGGGGGADGGGGAARSRVKVVLEGLRATKRWKMNVAMLSRDEKAAGERAWRLCGGEGSWV